MADHSTRPCVADAVGQQIFRGDVVAYIHNGGRLRIERRVVEEIRPNGTLKLEPLNRFGSGYVQPHNVVVMAEGNDI